MASSRYPSNNLAAAFGLPVRSGVQLPRMPSPPQQPAVVTDNPLERQAQAGAPAAAQPAAVVTPGKVAAGADPMARFLGSDFRSLGLRPGAAAVPGFATGGTVGTGSILVDPKNTTLPAPKAATTSPAPAPAAPAPASASILTPTNRRKPTVEQMGGLVPTDPNATYTRPAYYDTPPVLKSDPSEQDLNAQRATEAWVLPKGQVVGYGGKLNYDVTGAVTGEYGREADPATLARFRRRLAEGLSVEDLRRELDATAEGQEYNLQHDPLADQQFVTRMFRDALGREPTPEDVAFWMNRLSQGQDRRALAKAMQATAKGMGRAWEDAAIDKLIAQGDSFDATLKNDALETGLASDFKREIGRAPTPYELAKYANAVRSGALSTKKTVAQPKTIEQLLGRLGPVSPDKLVDTIYRAVIGRAPDPEGRAWLLGSYNNGNGMPLSQVIDLLRYSPEGYAAQAGMQDRINELDPDGSSPFLDMLRARKAAGFNRGGRVRAAAKGLKPRRAPITIEGYADGGEVGEPNIDQVLTYDRYAKYHNRVDESGTPYFDGISREDWDKLDAKQRLELSSEGDLIEGILVRPGDPGYESFKSKVGGEDGRAVVVTPYSFGAGKMGDEEGWLNDPTKEGKVGDFYFHSEDNQTPTFQRKDDEKNNWVAILGPLLGGAAGAAFAPAGGAAAGTVDVMAAAPGQGFGTALGTGSTNLASAAGTATSAMGGDAPAGTEIANEYAPGTDPTKYAPPAGSGNTPAPVDVSPTPPGGSEFTPGGPGTQAPAPVSEAGAPVSGTNQGSFFDRFLKWAKANPRQAVKLGMGVASFVGGSGGGGGGSSRTTGRYTPGAGGTYTPGAGSSGGGYSIGSGGTMNRPRGYVKGGRVAASGLPGYAVGGTVAATMGDPRLSTGPATGYDPAARMAQFAGGERGGYSITGDPELDAWIASLGSTPEGLAALQRLGQGDVSGLAAIAATGGEGTPMARGGGAATASPEFMAEMQRLAGTMRGAAPTEDARVAATGINPAARGSGVPFSGSTVGGNDLRALPYQLTPEEAAANASNPVARGSAAPFQGNTVAATPAPTGEPAADPAAAATTTTSSGATASNGTNNPMLSSYVSGGGGGVGPSGAMGSGGGGGGTGPMGDSRDPINELLGLSQEQINRYRKYDPIENQIIDEAGKAGSAALQEERAALAGEDVAGQFDRERGMRRRNMARGGVNPYSVQATAMDDSLGVSEAASKAAAMNEARRAERDSGFGKRMAAMGLGDSALKTGLGGISGALSGLLDRERTQASKDNASLAASVQAAGIAAREREAAADRYLKERGMSEDTRRFDLNFGEDVTRDRRNYGEGVRRFDTTFNEGRRRYDQDFGENRRRADRAYDRGVYTDDRDFDFGVWRTNNGLDREQDQINYNRGRQRWQDVGSGVRTGLDVWDSMKGYFNGGGRVASNGLPAYEHGGDVTAPGDGTVDTQLAMLANGETVVNKEGTEFLDKVAPGLLDRANEKGLQIRAMRNPRAASAGLPGGYSRGGRVGTRRC